MDMKKRSFKKLITLSLTLAMLTGVAGCGKQQSLNAETNPDTPVSDVQFPLKEKAELSFITSAPATSTQDPNERTIFKRTTTRLLRLPRNASIICVNGFRN